jgi:SAM-dependent methyltransferase
MDARYVAVYEQLEREHWWWVSRRDILLGLLHTLTRSWPAAGRPTLLDLGCGAGVNLAAFRERADCQGIEPNPLLAARARVNSGVKVQVGSLPDDLPAFDHPFDFVTLLDVLEHIDDDVMTLKTAARLLSPGGRIIINVPALPWMWSEHDAVNHHKRRYVATGLREILMRANLDVRLIRYWGTLLVPLAWAERRVRRWRRNGSYAVNVPSPRVNTVMRRLVRAEYSATAKVGLPVGLSLLAVAGAARQD